MGDHSAFLPLWRKMMFIKVAALKLSYVTSYCDCNMPWKMAARLVVLTRRRKGKEDVAHKNRLNKETEGKRRRLRQK